MANQSALSAVSLAATGTTGNVTGTGVAVRPPSGHGTLVGFQFVVEAIGATPTITFKYQGSFDNVNFYDVAYILDSTSTLSVATRVVTTVAGFVQWLENSPSRGYNFFRVVTTLNTNVTYRAELWVPKV